MIEGYELEFISTPLASQPDIIEVQRCMGTQSIYLQYKIQETDLGFKIKAPYSMYYWKPFETKGQAYEWILRDAKTVLYSWKRTSYWQLHPLERHRQDNSQGSIF